MLVISSARATGKWWISLLPLSLYRDSKYEDAIWNCPEQCWAGSALLGPEPESTGKTAGQAENMCVSLVTIGSQPAIDLTTNFIKELEIFRSVMLCLGCSFVWECTELFRENYWALEHIILSFLLLSSFWDKILLHVTDYIVLFYYVFCFTYRTYLQLVEAVKWAVQRCHFNKVRVAK